MGSAIDSTGSVVALKVFLVLDILAVQGSRRMKNSSKCLTLSVVSLISLSGCLEVDDDSNRELVNSLNQQNTILTEQNDLLASQNQNTVTISGSIFDIATQTPIEMATASIDVYQGDSLLVSAQSNEAGGFEIEGLPPSSDLTLLVSFANDEYMSRAFFITTRTVVDSDAFDDIGFLDVSEPVTVSFLLVDSESGEFVGDLAFSGYSHNGSGSRAFEYAHTTTYDASTGLYTVTLPKNIDVTLQASIDSDGNSQRDYEVQMTNGMELYTSGTFLNILSANEIDGVAEASLSEQEEYVDTSKNIYITLIDENGDSIESAEFINEESGIVSTYNAQTQQYELTVPYSGLVSLAMPSITTGESTYSSGSITIYDSENSQTGETSLRISGNGFDSNTNYGIADSEDINLVLVGRVVTAYSDLEVVANIVAADDYVNTIYYSEPVTIDEQAVSLAFDDIEIVFGNDSADDGVPAGYTELNLVERLVPLDVALDDNETKLTLTPQESLFANTTYRYAVEQVAAQSDAIAVELYDDDVEFTTPVALGSSSFDINDIFVDNNNYYSNGSILVAENTAGVPSGSYEYDSQAYLYLPTTIENLNFLVLRLVGYTENNSQYTTTSTFEVVIDGNVQFSRRYMGLEVAENENVNANSLPYSTSVAFGSTLTTGQYTYRQSTNIYSIGDNQGGSVNSLTFSYEYQTTEGVTETGTLTLPVL